ncbi:TetR family transcriptional regulator [Metallumcola ferriviriculae]|uniref:TetR family transcriptional regulator n=1 Tax=Metallumcola ferriviriculae TaxID=3039180 RepID=A0AAU0UPE9_9FIRM|nr:TetR family transcriptional regulator [Desulfitibacteraceae bacterium MK1]
MPKRKGEKYEAIIDAAVKIFARHGYYGAQVTKIAKEAGVADGTIYLYFENKEDILISLFTEKMGRFIAAVSQELSSQEDAVEQLHTLVRRHFSHLAADADLAVVTQIELRQSDPQIRQGISQPLKKYFEAIEKVVENGKLTGQFNDWIDVKTARKMIFGTMDEVVTCWVLSQKEYSLLSLVEPVLKILSSGIVAK